MRKNVGSLDSAIRAMVALALLLAAGATSQWLVLSVACVIVALVLVRTALNQSCPLYTLLGIETQGGRGGGPPAARRKA